MPDNRKKKKASLIYDRLAGKYADAGIELVYSNPLELTVATILSAQCTDKMVNQVTPALFAEYKTPRDYLDAKTEGLEKKIKPTGFFRQKTKSIRGVMQGLLEHHDGKIPQDMEALIALPGIGRKTANVILGNAFGVPGIAVDTHVKRVTNRLGLTTSQNPDKIELELMDLYPRSVWVKLNHVFIFHGRQICKARKPACSYCPVANHCDYYAGLSRQPPAPK